MHETTLVRSACVQVQPHVSTAWCILYSRNSCETYHLTLLYLGTYSDYLTKDLHKTQEKQTLGETLFTFIKAYHGSTHRVKDKH